MDFHFTESEMAVIASLVFVAIILFQFFIMVLMPPKDKHRRR